MELWGLPERCTMVGEVPIGSNMHRKTVRKSVDCFEGIAGHGEVN